MPRLREIPAGGIQPAAPPILNVGAHLQQMMGQAQALLAPPPVAAQQPAPPQP
jgi:hypothetical protein